jgi:hypothetical protein
MTKSDQKRTKDIIKYLKYSLLGLIVSCLLAPTKVSAWSEHPLMVYTALKNYPALSNAGPVEVKSLKTFLTEVEDKMADFLKIQEEWSVKNLPNYKPCPEGLAFKSTGNLDDILVRFFSAIRINPNAKIPLYLFLLPGDSIAGREIATRSGITTLNDTSSMSNAIYVLLRQGEKTDPFNVLYTASDEPDYGFDLGLFDDNKTDYGLKYAFGNQPFGNPNLEYSSQAPFHMGFYHEAKILYKFGPFLKCTYLDYRIFLYKSLSEFAFKNNQPYWGWRFLGWGMHYVGDVSMPYHMKPLPGVSTLRMLWINLKAIIGLPGAKERAVQLVSNRHTVLEEFQVQVIRNALLKNENNPLVAALQKPDEPVPFTLNNLYHEYTRTSAESAKKIDKAIVKNMPATLVSDPKTEANNQPEIKQIIEIMKQKGGEKNVEDMTLALTGRMSAFSMNIHSYLDSVIK